MSPKEITEYGNSRKKAYKFYINELKSISTKEEFSKKIDELYLDIFDDENLIFEETFCKSVAKPIMDIFNDVRSAYKHTVQFYKDFKILKLWNGN